MDRKDYIGLEVLDVDHSFLSLCHQFVNVAPYIQIVTCLYFEGSIF